MRMISGIFSVAFAILTFTVTADSADESVITNVAEITRLSFSGVDRPQRFDVVLTTLTDYQLGAITFAATDGQTFTSITPIGAAGNIQLTAGDRVRVRGLVGFHNGIYQCCGEHFEVLGHGPRPEPIDATAADIYSGRLTYAIVRIRGTVKDAFRDEANPRYTFIVLVTTDGTIYIPSVYLTDDHLKRLIDATVSVVGICTSYRNTGPRAKLGYEVHVVDPDDITVLSAPQDDPFEVPELAGNVHDILHAATDGPFRRKLRGQVLATWRRKNVLLKTATGEHSTVQLAQEKPPRIGETIEAAGLPETDFFHLNLTSAIWRPAEPITSTNPPPVTVTAEQLLTDGNGRHRFNVDYGAQTIRLTGIVRNLSPVNESESLLHLGCGDFLIPVYRHGETRSLDAIEVGCQVEVTGVCIMETENWRPQAPFPHVTGISIVTDGDDAIRVLSRPPWWTTGRLLALIGSLFALLVGILIWNYLLNRLVNRRGRELLREQIGRERAQLRTDERTRLAVELHDSLAQNLSGVAMEIAAAVQSREDGLDAVMNHVAVADKALASCQDDLRNDLWDLRIQALEAPNLTQAVEQTLRPLCREGRVSVRFDVPRGRLDDSTAHHLLRIVRELVANAIKHGNATVIKVAGCLDGQRILFSVTDNGCGFDPDTCPGVSQGHFGLSGIRMRLRKLGGKITFESQPGGGTRAAVVIDTTREKATEV